MSDPSQSIQTIGRLSRALWRDPEQGDPIVLDAYSAVSLLDEPEEGDSALSPRQMEERVAAILLERARGTSSALNRLKDAEKSGGRSRAFYSLFPEEKFVLMALHLEKWSYGRVGRVLGRSAADVEEMAWRIRIQVSGRYPHGSALETPSCPEYDIHRPWTQRFLDEEFSNGGEKVFLQSHLAVCGGCRRSLASCRELYYVVDGLLPRAQLSSGNAFSALERGVRKIERQKKAYHRNSGRRNPGPSDLAEMWKRPDIILVLFGIVLLIANALIPKGANNSVKAGRTAVRSPGLPEP